MTMELVQYVCGPILQGICVLFWQNPNTAITIVYSAENLCQ